MVDISLCIRIWFLLFNFGFGMTTVNKEDTIKDSVKEIKSVENNILKE